MRKTLAILSFVVLAQVISNGQTIPKLFWTQEAPSLAGAQGYTYRYYADNATTGVVLNNVTCSGTASPFLCSTPLPITTPGNHSISLTSENITGESTKSVPLDFEGIPKTPGSLRIGK